MVNELSEKDYTTLREFIKDVEDTARCERVREKLEAHMKGYSLADPSTFVFFNEVMERVQVRGGTLAYIGYSRVTPRIGTGRGNQNQVIVHDAADRKCAAVVSSSLRTPGVLTCRQLVDRFINFNAGTSRKRLRVRLRSSGPLCLGYGTMSLLPGSASLPASGRR